jgi:hypothetical protein
MHATCLGHLVFPDLITKTIFGEEYILQLTKVLIMQVSLDSYYHLSLRPQIFSSKPCSQAPSVNVLPLR